MIASGIIASVFGYIVLRSANTAFSFALPKCDPLGVGWMFGYIFALLFILFSGYIGILAFDYGVVPYFEDGEGETGFHKTADFIFFVGTITLEALILLLVARYLGVIYCP